MPTKYPENTQFPTKVEEFRPTNGKILIERDPRPTHDGAIELATPPKQHTGTIIYTDSFDSDSANYDAGTRVLVSSFGGTDLEFEGSEKEYVLIEPAQIYGFIGGNS